MLNFLRRLFPGKSVVALQNVDCFLRLQNALRVVTKMSSCQRNTLRRWRIKQLRIFFFLLFFYFPTIIAEGHIHSNRGEIPGPRLLMTALVLHLSTGYFTHRVPQCNYASQKNPVIFFCNPHKNSLRHKQKTLPVSGHKETWVTLLSALINTVLQGGCSVFDFLIFLNCYYIWSGSVGHLSFNFILIYQFCCWYIQAVCWWILFVFILLIFMSI